MVVRVREWVLRIVASGDQIRVIMDHMLDGFVKIVTHATFLHNPSRG